MPRGPVGRWQLVFDDEFNGTNLNLRKWLLYNSIGDGGHGLRRPSALTLNGRGQVVVTAQMISGILVSGGMAASYNQTYGYYEFRVRTDPDPTYTLSGVVLTWPMSGRWPIDGENDIYETQNGGGHRPFRTFIHYGPANEAWDYTHNVDGSRWHVLGMNWTPTSITIYRDGAAVWTMNDSNAIPNVPHHICIQLDAVGDQSLVGPVHMYVDYVRIWRPLTGGQQLPAQ